MRYPMTPQGEEVNPELYHPSLRRSMLRSRYAYVTREAIASVTVQPLEKLLFRHWLNEGPLASQIERLGLPRRPVSAYLGDVLDVQVNPQALSQHVSMVHSFESKAIGRRARSQFIWEGDWDIKTFDFKSINRYQFIEDIWRNRNDIAASNAYVELVENLRGGKPFRSHHKGVLLNSFEKITIYLDQYLAYMKSMKENGFDPSLGKEKLGVAIGRHGQLLKINRGLHRLAMAQVLGLDVIVVRVMGVHRGWWNENKKENNEGSLFSVIKNSECGD